LTPGRIAPLVSWTTPYRVAVVTCARTFAAGRNIVAMERRMTATTREQLVIQSLLVTEEQRRSVIPDHSKEIAAAAECRAQKMKAR
jgi:hypothetical protein